MSLDSKQGFLPFTLPFIEDDERKEILGVLESGWITTGPKVKEFEKNFAQYIGCKHAIALNSCTAALHLALEAIGLKENDEVITSPMTFAATAEVVRYFKARPVFVDIEPDTFNIDPKKIECMKGKSWTDGKAKVIIPVHYAGQPCNMNSTLQIAKRYGIKVIEDAAHAFPARYKNKIVGNIGDITCFSFYATKSITTGEGGMAVTNHSKWADRIRTMSLHGITKDAWERYTALGSWNYKITAPGYKYNMTDLSAALGIAQLKKVDFLRQRRERIATEYNEAFKDLPQIIIPVQKNNIKHSWHLYVIKLNLECLSINRDRFIDELKKRGIGTSVHFIPLHLHPYYRKTYGYKPKDFPVAYEIFKQIISLPIYPKMTDENVTKVIEGVIDVAKKYKK